MKVKKGTVFALVVIFLAGLGLWAAYQNREWPDAVTPPSSSVASPTTRARRTQTKTKPSSPSGGRYAFDYPGISPAVAAVSQQKWNLLLINKSFALPADFKPALAVCLPTVYPEDLQLDARAAPKYKEMYYAALADGAELIPYSGYRKISTQQSNFDSKIAEYRSQGKSEAEAVFLASQRIAPPGCSEHEAGLAMDITRKGVWGTRTDFEKTKEFAWLTNHAAEYGFILRYPKDKTDITGVDYEPWHWRYVGKEAALAIKASGQCLEEFLDQVVH